MTSEKQKSNPSGDYLDHSIISIVKVRLSDVLFNIGPVFGSAVYSGDLKSDYLKSGNI